MNKQTITIGQQEYESDRFMSTDLYCPECGKQKVLIEKSDGDYYSGPIHYCLKCHFVFHLN